MKKIFTTISVLALCLVSCLPLTACKSNKLSFNKLYNPETIEFMGFSGTEEDVKTYLESVGTSNETNFVSNYLDLFTRVQLKFQEDGSGELIIKQIDTIEGIKDPVVEGEADEELKNFYNNLLEKNMIDDSGNAHFSFKYTKDNDKIIFNEIHTNISSLGNNGNATLNDIIDKISSRSEGKYKITNDVSTAIILKDNKIVVTITLEARLVTTDPNPDIVSDIVITFSK